MKQSLIPKPELIQKHTFNRAKNESLKILSLNNDELQTYLREQTNQNPYLHMKNNDVDADAFLEYDHSRPSLYDEIMNQLQLCEDHVNTELCAYLLSQLDSNGYFKVNHKTLYEMSGFPPALLDRHLQLLHTLDPIGAFAFDLKDCLQIQCEADESPASETAAILCEYLEDLALKRMDHIIEETQLSAEEIREGFTFIRSLNPKPAANYATDTVYVMPEFHIENMDGHIHIQLLNDDLSLDMNMEEDTQEHEEMAQFMRAQREQAKAIMNSMQKRNMTLLQIMQYICDVQKDFFLHHGALQHLTLDMVSKQSGLHTSTISRAVTNKSFEFENRYYPLKKMFSSGGASGITQEEIKKRIVNIITAEDRRHPYSDEAIRKMLLDDGIQISRRAVTKYREACYLFNSSKRRQA